MVTRSFLGLILLFIGMQHAFANDTTDISEVVCRINPEKYGIKIDYRYPTGPWGFSVLGNSVAIGNDNEIIIITNKGDVRKRIKFKAFIEHFDLDSNGNGFMKIRDSLYAIKDFEVKDEPVKTNFLHKVRNVGRLRIDLISNEQVRFISFEPDFIAIANRNNLDSARIRDGKNLIDSIMIWNMGWFVGQYKDFYVFVDYNVDLKGQHYFRLAAFTIKNGDFSDFKEFEILGRDYGSYFWWSYCFRLDETKGCFYVMFFKNKNIVIRKFDLEKILALAKTTQGERWKSELKKHWVEATSE